MKKTLKKLVLIGLFAPALFIVSCSGGGKTDSDGKSSDSKGETKNANLISPDKIDINKPIPVETLKAAVFNWHGKTVTVTGYCDFFWEKGKIDKKVGLTIKPEKGLKKVVECNMKQEYPEEFEKTTPITIKGEFEKGFYGEYIVLKNCELVKKGETIADKGYVHPDNYKGENLSAADFFKSYYGWMNKEIAVIGYYQSTTTSTTSYGKTIRVDLIEETSRKKMVGCRMKTEPPESLKDNRSGVIIKGIYKGEAFGNVLLEECELVSKK